MDQPAFTRVPDDATVQSMGKYLAYRWYVDGIPHHKYVHRHVWETNHGLIPPGYVVHHEDRNRLNNDISNLRCMPSGEHTRLHNTCLDKSRAYAIKRRIKLETYHRDRLPVIDEMLRQGLNQTGIAKHLGCSRVRVDQIVKQAGYKIEYFGVLVPKDVPKSHEWDCTERILDIVDHSVSVEHQNKRYLLAIMMLAMVNQYTKLTEPKPVIAIANTRYNADGSRKSCSNGCKSPVTAKGLCSRCYRKQHIAAKHIKTAA